MERSWVPARSQNFKKLWGSKRAFLLGGFLPAAASEKRGSAGGTSPSDRQPNAGLQGDEPEELILAVVAGCTRLPADGPTPQGALVRRSCDYALALMPNAREPLGDANRSSQAGLVGRRCARGWRQLTARRPAAVPRMRLEEVGRGCAAAIVVRMTTWQGSELDLPHFSLPSSAAPMQRSVPHGSLQMGRAADMVAAPAGSRAPAPRAIYR
jgi:hypothetical protein